MLTVRWLDNSDLPELQANYAAVIVAGQQHRTVRWLLDVRRRVLPTSEAAQWVTDEWLPRAVAALTPTRLRIAYLISPTREETLRSNTTLQPGILAATAPDRPYDLRLFADEGEAVRWLTA